MTRRSFSLVDLVVGAALLAGLGSVVAARLARAADEARSRKAIVLLADLHQRAAAYYAEVREGRSRCSLGRSATLPPAPGPHPTWADFDDDPVFRALGLGAGESLYSLHVSGRAGCDLGERGETLYFFRALGDLDADGVTSLFELRGIRGVGGLERSAIRARAPLE